MIGFKATAANSSPQVIKAARAPPGPGVRVARTSVADAVAAAARAGVSIKSVAQLTPSMHLLLLPEPLSSGDVDATLGRLRGDASIDFAAVDGRRHAHAVPNDPLFIPNANSSAGQWYLQTPTPVAPSDASAIDAVSAWGLSTGASGVVIEGSGHRCKRDESRERRRMAERADADSAPAQRFAGLTRVRPLALTRDSRVRCGRTLRPLRTRSVRCERLGDEYRQFGCFGAIEAFAERAFDLREVLFFVG